MEHVNIIASLIIALAAALGCAATAYAQPYPSKPITLVVGFAPGGPTDTVARIIADHMKTTFGQTVVVENVGGAAGTIGAARVARAAPDGYTLNVGQWTSNVGAPAITPTPYHVINDFEPVARLTTSYLWIVGRSSLPATNLKELIAWLKANPDKATGAIVGAGSAAHICFIDFQNKSGTKFALVPYKGGTPALQDLVGGQVDISCLEAAQTMQQFRAGMVKVFGVLANRRWTGAPHVPTLGGRRIAGRPDRVLARPVGAQGHAERYRRQAQRRGGGGVCRSGGAQALCRSRPRDARARAAVTTGAVGASQGRARPLVAGDQGGGDQDAVGAG